MDVKHVSHIGYDGPAIESPSWMKGFDGRVESKSGPLDKKEAIVETPEVNWVSEAHSAASSACSHHS
nr:hypothetical protein [Tanacetum cinerariifolium]